MSQKSASKEYYKQSPEGISLTEEGAVVLSALDITMADLRVMSADDLRDYAQQFRRPMGKDTRYFDLDRWAAENGFDEDWVAQAKAGLLRIAKPAKKEKEAGCGDSDWKERQANPHYGKGGFKRPTGEPDRKVAARKNDHPTCKPVALFGWLLALGCPKDGGIMLDPFVGSGSSLVAAIKGGWQYIGIDSDRHYCDIAEARTAFAKDEQVLAKEEQRQGRLL